MTKAGTTLAAKRFVTKVTTPRAAGKFKPTGPKAIVFQGFHKRVQYAFSASGLKSKSVVQLTGTLDLPGNLINLCFVVRVFRISSGQLINIQ